MILRIAAHRVLQPRATVLGGPDMVLATHAHGVIAAHVGVDERVDRQIAEGVAMAAHGLLRDFGKADALDAGMGAGEILPTIMLRPTA